ncbi:hypothetical protein WH47_12065 [Habropoda laboriosa]|uniref:Uncharacterized protein n=1 Tax=Habropoda laboriosa TaxID=597456 RepID=A0A0L7R1D4_9HYME|nr:hypothetical protein WH47_12065 [Habropoda laboriosa]
MKTPQRTTSRIIKQDLRFEAYRRSTGQRLTEALRQIRVRRAKRLPRWHANGGYRQILFISEKMFTVEEKFNR